MAPPSSTKAVFTSVPQYKPLFEAGNLFVTCAEVIEIPLSPIYLIPGVRPSSVVLQHSADGGIGGGGRRRGSTDDGRSGRGGSQTGGQVPPVSGGTGQGGQGGAAGPGTPTTGDGDGDGDEAPDYQQQFDDAIGELEASVSSWEKKYDEALGSLDTERATSDDLRAEVVRLKAVVDQQSALGVDVVSVLDRIQSVRVRIDGIVSKP